MLRYPSSVKLNPTWQATQRALPSKSASPAALLVPGAVLIPAVENPTGSSGGGANQGVTKTFPGGVTISTNGSRQNQISYRLDGGNKFDLD